MEPTESSETSAFSTRTPGRYPKENALHIKHGESLKSRSSILFCARTLTMTFVMTSKWNDVQSKFSYFRAMVHNIRLSRLSSSRLWYILAWYQHFGEICCSQIQKSTFKAITLNTEVTDFYEISVIYRIRGLISDITSQKLHSLHYAAFKVYTPCGMWLCVVLLKCRKVNTN